MLSATPSSISDERALILCLHDIGGKGKYSLSQEQFREVLETLKADFDVISVRDWLDRKNTQSTSRKPAVILTFDDGYPSLTRIVVPMLSEYDFGATFYIYLNRYHDHSVFFRNMGKTSGKIEIGSHSFTHEALSEKNPDQMFNELYLSRKKLEYLTGKNITGFAWPYGKYDKKQMELIRKAGYDYQVGVSAEFANRDEEILERFTLQQPTPIEDLNKLIRDYKKKIN